MTRTLGASLKASLHHSGECHIRAPDATKWRGKGVAPKYLDEWKIDTASAYEFPFGILIPNSELRAGPWAAHRDNGTLWLKPGPQATEIAFFLTRITPLSYDRLRVQGWDTVLTDAQLPDGRRLLIVAGNGTISDGTRRQIEQAREHVASVSAELANPRLLAYAANDAGTRRFIEVAAR
jgi:hypothetical protein